MPYEIFFSYQTWWKQTFTLTGTHCTTSTHVMKLLQTRGDGSLVAIFPWLKCDLISCELIASPAHLLRHLDSDVTVKSDGIWRRWRTFGHAATSIVGIASEWSRQAKQKTSKVIKSNWKIVIQSSASSVHRHSVLLQIFQKATTEWSFVFIELQMMRVKVGSLLTSSSACDSTSNRARWEDEHKTAQLGSSSNQQC